MTAVLRGKGVEVATGYLGVHEEPAHSNKTIIGQKFGWNGVAWCAEFYTVCEHEAGNTDFAGSASCGVLVGRYKSGQNGLWLGKPDISQILIDDEVFFGKDGGEHTGRVRSVDVKNRIVHTIEGNIGDAVRNEDRPYDGGVEVIYGFGRPARIDATTTPPSKPNPTPSKKRLYDMLVQNTPTGWYLIIGTVRTNIGEARAKNLMSQGVPLDSCNADEATKFNNDLLKSRPGHTAVQLPQTVGSDVSYELKPEA